MAVNRRFKSTITDKAPNKAIINPIEFYPDSPYYHKEDWREIKNWMVANIKPGYYVSNYGRVYTTNSSPTNPNGGLLNPSRNAKGYWQIVLQKTTMNDRGKFDSTSCKIHRLVLTVFKYIVGCNMLEVRHIDEDNDNNCLWNLEWIDPRENTRRSINYGLNQPTAITAENSQDIAKSIADADRQAKEIFDKAVKISDPSEITKLAEEYGVERRYILGLRAGTFKPSLRLQFLKNGGVIQSMPSPIRSKK